MTPESITADGVALKHWPQQQQTTVRLSERGLEKVTTKVVKEELPHIFKQLIYQIPWKTPQGYLRDVFSN